MDINQFTTSEVIPPHYILMISLDYTQPGKIAAPMLVYSGLLRDVPAVAMETARLSIVHPGTLAAIKSGADALVVGAKVEENCVHDWVPHYVMGEPNPVDEVCGHCGVSKSTVVDLLTANQR